MGKLSKTEKLKLHFLHMVRLSMAKWWENLLSVLSVGSAVWSWRRNHTYNRDIQQCNIRHGIWRNWLVKSPGSSRTRHYLLILWILKAAIKKAFKCHKLTTYDKTIQDHEPGQIRTAVCHRYQLEIYKIRRRYFFITLVKPRYKKKINLFAVFTVSVPQYINKLMQILR